MKKLLSIIPIAIAVLAILSCKQAIPETPAAPDSYKKFLAAYRGNLGYTAIEQKGSATEITFFDETVLKITDMGIDDCRTKEPKVLATDLKGQWMLGGELLGIYKKEGTTLEDAYPLYVYFTSDRLVVKLDNGNSFIIRRVDPPLPKVSALPIIRIKTDGNKGIYDKENYVPGKVTIENPDHMYAEQDNVTFEMGIRGRGNSTWGMPKKPYRIKFTEKQEMLGMPASKNWALLADYADKTLLRNYTAMELSRICDFPWTPNMRKVEVYLNGKYIGVYTLAEHKEVAKKKVNIDTDAGDVYFEIEQNQDETVCWWTKHSVPMMFSDPDEPSKELEAEMKKFFDDFETALWNKEFKNVYDNYIDLKTFIDYFIVQELTKNIDGNLRKSTFITKKKGEKLVMYHLWDFDLTMGNCDYFDSGNNGPTGWWIKEWSYIGQYHGWYYRLFMDPEFCKMVKDRWNELYPHFQKVPQFIDENAALLINTEAQARNFKVWSITDMDWWNRSHKVSSYRGEIDYLKDFYNKRLEWLNTNINKL